LTAFDGLAVQISAIGMYRPWNNFPFLNPEAFRSEFGVATFVQWLGD
jgi:hypothetical protein